MNIAITTDNPGQAERMLRIGEYMQFIDGMLKELRDNAKYKDDKDAAIISEWINKFAKENGYDLDYLRGYGD